MKHETVNRYVVKVNDELNRNEKGRQGFCSCKGKDIFFTYRLLAESKTSGWVWYCIPEKSIKSFSVRQRKAVNHFQRHYLKSVVYVNKRLRVKIEHEKENINYG